MQLHRKSKTNASMDPGSSATYMPAWVKIFGVVYMIAFALFAARHLVPGGMGHLSHGEMDAHAPPAEHGQHQP